MAKQGVTKVKTFEGRRRNNGLEIYITT